MIVTHTDTDGLVSALIVAISHRILFKDVFTIGYRTDRDNVIEKMTEGYLQSNRSMMYSANPLYYLDLSFRPEEFEWARNKKKKNHWIWIDHHISSNDFDPKGVFDEVHLDTEGGSCAADICWKAYEDIVKADNNLMEWRQVAHDRDLWINEYKDMNMKIDMVIKYHINKLGESHSIVNQLLETMAKYPPKIFVMTTANIWQIEWKKYIDSKTMALTTGQVLGNDEGQKVFIGYCTESPSDVSEDIFEVHNPDIVALITRSKADINISLRSREIDVESIAKGAFAGGGHRLAAGGKLETKHLSGGYITIYKAIRDVIYDIGSTAEEVPEETKETFQEEKEEEIPVPVKEVPKQSQKQHTQSKRKR